jgi:hypothetical protein
MTTAYDEARKRLEKLADGSGWETYGTSEPPSLAADLRALLSGPPEPSEEEVAAIVDAFATAENGLSYGIHLVKLVDGIETRRLKVQGETFEYTDDESNDFDANQACYDHLNRVRKQLRIEAVQALYRSRRNG